MNGNLHDLRAQVEQHQRRVRELEEQIESDDRAERLEETLKNTQDRADELEFQLSKLRQVRPFVLDSFASCSIGYLHRPTRRSRPSAIRSKTNYNRKLRPKLTGGLGIQRSSSSTPPPGTSYHP